MKRQRSTTPCPDGSGEPRSPRWLAALVAVSVLTCVSATSAEEASTDADGGARLAVVLHGHVVSPPPAVRSLTKPMPGYDTARLAPEPPPPEPPVLARFRSALDGLGSGRRTEPVRILWLGDSHTAADFWSDAVRGALAARYGDGGPGFVSLGRKDYRHSGVKVLRDGRWHTFPKKPSLWVKQNDGVFGLTGIRAVPEHKKSRAQIAIPKALAMGTLRWDLAYRMPSRQAKFRVDVDDGTSHAVDASSCDVGAVQHLTWETTRATGFVLDQAAGDPEIFGVVVERARPGVVLDTLGINGARIATPLAWDAATWVDELKRRKPSLFVLAYGTNEVGDQVAPWRYEGEVEKLVARVRQGAPDADCVVVGPTDRLDRASWLPNPRTSEVDAAEKRAARKAGCWYVSALDVMTQSGGYARWAALLPPLAARDGVHLTMKGYSEIGAAMARSLLGDVTVTPAVPP